MRLQANALAIITLLGSLAISPAIASRGDRLPEFRTCVDNCIENSCGPQSPSPIVLPLYLRLLAWDCPSECDYRCQHTTTALLRSRNLPVEQYHGKWPFYRILGMQEIMSVIFSMLNFYAHYQGLKNLNRRLPKSHPLGPIYRGFSYVGMWCWAWSSIFHTRDLGWTESMDYYGAGASVLYGLFLSVVRIFRGYYSGSSRRLDPKRTIKPWVYLWGAACIVAYLSHVYYLTFVRWSYTYNMTANVIVGSIQNVLWSYFSIRQYVKRGGSSEATWPGLIVLWIVVAMGLELLDFPPIAGLLDAHALWHAATVGPAMWWYSFLMADAEFVKGDAVIALKKG